jgi:hypothetical protein
MSGERGFVFGASRNFPSDRFFVIGCSKSIGSFSHLFYLSFVGVYHTLFDCVGREARNSGQPQEWLCGPSRQTLQRERMSAFGGKAAVTPNSIDVAV